MKIVQGAVPPLPPELIAKFRAIVGDKYAVTDPADIAPYVTEVTDGEFIHQLCRGGEQRSRARSSWRAVPAAALAPSPRQPRPSLRLVAANGDQ